MGNPLIDLAQQSGLFPEMFSDRPAGPDYQNGVPQGAVSHPGSESGDASGYPGPGMNSDMADVPSEGSSPVYSPFNAAMFSSGGAVSGASTNPGVAPGESKSTGTTREVATSQSASGFSEKKAAQIDKRDAALNTDLARADATAYGRGKPMVDAQTMARDSQHAASKAVADATIDKIEAEGHQARFLGDLQKSFADAEMEANVQASAMMTQAKNDYMTALADFRATKVDPSQLWGNMSGGQRFGTLVSAFVHDFLGVKGMHTSAMDTLNKAIDRNIDAQVQAIKTKGEVAEGFKSLWYMQRNQASSDAEARARVKTFLLESAKQNVIANMSQYESGLASAQGQSALAAIDKEYAKNLTEIYKHIDSNAISLRDQAVRWHGDKLRAANESYANAIRAKAVDLDRQRLEFDKQKEADKNKSSFIPANVIYNPETNKGEWYARPGTRPETVDKIKENVIAATAFNDAVQQLRDFERTLPPQFDLTKGTRLSPQQAREYSAIQKRLAHAMVKANGERATDKDVDQYMESIPMDTKFTYGGVEKILADTQRAGFVTPQAWIQQYADDIPANLQPEGPKGQLFAGAKTDATAVANGTDKIKSPSAKWREEAGGMIYAPDYKKEVKADEVPDYVNRFDNHFSQTNPKAYTKMEDEAGHSGINKAEFGLSSLAGLAVRGDQDALKELERQANGWLTSTNRDDDWRGAYAAMLVQDVKNNWLEQAQTAPAAPTNPDVPPAPPMIEGYNAGGAYQGKP